MKRVLTSSLELSSKPPGLLRSPWVLGILLTLGLGLATPVVASAQDGARATESSEAAPTDTGEAQPRVKPGGEGGTSFEATDLSEQETPHYTLMIVAYAAMWCLLLGYAFVLFRRQRSIDGELAQLRDRLTHLSDLVEDELES